MLSYRFEVRFVGRSYVFGHDAWGTPTGVTRAHPAFIVRVLD